MTEHPKTSESRLKANKKYLSKFADIKIRVDPTQRDIIQKHADSIGESMSSFIKRAISETMSRDLEKLKTK
jgi:uncharacterized protein (DUF1778 family)